MDTAFAGIFGGGVVAGRLGPGFAVTGEEAKEHE